MPINENTIVRPTGISELDRILYGGFPTNAAILLSGPSGAGKTNLAMQWIFSGYHLYKESGVYFTLSESSDKLIKNLKKMSFFNRDYIASVDMRVDNFDLELASRPGLHILDIRQILEDLKLGNKDFTKKDVSKLCATLFHAVGKSDARRVVLDSITAIAYRLQDRNLIRQFIFELGAYLGRCDINIMMTSEVIDRGYSVFGVEEFVSDGIIKLSYGRSGGGLIRKLEMIKMRGSDYDSYPTTFQITNNGVVLFPRLARELNYPVSDQRLSTGVPGFDEMTDGGHFEGSAIMIAGPSGTGKTIAAMQFLFAGLQQNEKCLYVSFEETREQLIRNAKSFGWDLKQYEKDGLFRIFASDPENQHLDAHIRAITSIAESFGAKRVVIDSFSAISNVFSPNVLRDFSSSIINYFKKLNITTLFTMATEGLAGSISVSDAHLSTSVDAIILFRFVEIQSELRRAVLILKMRGSAHDRKLREIIIGNDGLRVSADFSGYEGVLTGSSRRVAESVVDQLHALFLGTLGPMGEKIFAEEKAKGLTLSRLKKLIEELCNQGIISSRRKDEFIIKMSIILGEKTS